MTPVTEAERIVRAAYRRERRWDRYAPLAVPLALFVAAVAGPTAIITGMFYAVRAVFG